MKISGLRLEKGEINTSSITTHNRGIKNVDLVPPLKIAQDVPQKVRSKSITGNPMTYREERNRILIRKNSLSKMPSMNTSYITPTSVLSRKNLNYGMTLEDMGSGRNLRENHCACCSRNCFPQSSNCSFLMGLDSNKNHQAGHSMINFQSPKGFYLNERTPCNSLNPLFTSESAIGMGTFGYKGHHNQQTGEEKAQGYVCLNIPLDHEEIKSVENIIHHSLTKKQEIPREPGLTDRINPLSTSRDNDIPIFKEPMTDKQLLDKEDTPKRLEIIQTTTNETLEEMENEYSAKRELKERLLCSNCCSSSPKVDQDRDGGSNDVKLNVEPSMNRLSTDCDTKLQSEQSLKEKEEDREDCQEEASLEVETKHNDSEFEGRAPEENEIVQTRSRELEVAALKIAGLENRVVYLEHQLESAKAREINFRKELWRIKEMLSTIPLVDISEDVKESNQENSVKQHFEVDVEESVSSTDCIQEVSELVDNYKRDREKLKELSELKRSLSEVLQSFERKFHGCFAHLEKLKQLSEETKINTY